MHFHVLYQTCVVDDYPHFPCEATNLDIPLGKHISDLKLPDPSLDSIWIFLVSLEMRRRLEKHGIHPFISDSDYQFDFSSLLAWCPELLLNKDAFLMPFGGVYKSQLVPEKVFLRPTSGNKLFSGQVMNKTDIKEFGRMLSIQDEELTVVARPQCISNETRVFVVGGRIIGMAPYQHEDCKTVSFGCPGKATHDLIHKLSQCPYLPDAYVADVCEDENRDVKLVELNSISTSGTYSKEYELVKDLTSFILTGRL